MHDSPFTFMPPHVLVALVVLLMLKVSLRRAKGRIFWRDLYTHTHTYTHEICSEIFNLALNNPHQAWLVMQVGCHPLRIIDSEALR